MINGRSRRQRLLIGGELIAMALIFAVSIYELGRLGTHPARPDQELEPGNFPGAGIIVRTEALQLWLPEAWSELAKRDLSLSGARTRAEMLRSLELRKREGLWYALTTRMYLVNGRFEDITVVWRPYDHPRDLSEFLDLLSKLSGDIPGDSTADFSNVTIRVVPDALSKADPREVIAELLGRP